MKSKAGAIGSYQGAERMWMVKKLVIRERRTDVVGTEKLTPQEIETKTEIVSWRKTEVCRKIEQWQRKRETER